jgi:hypothetical protein
VLALAAHVLIPALDVDLLRRGRDHDLGGSRLPRLLLERGETVIEAGDLIVVFVLVDLVFFVGQFERLEVGIPALTLVVPDSGDGGAVEFGQVRVAVLGEHDPPDLLTIVVVERFGFHR